MYVIHVSIHPAIQQPRSHTSIHTMYGCMDVWLELYTRGHCFSPTMVISGFSPQPFYPHRCKWPMSAVKMTLVVVLASWGRGYLVTCSLVDGWSSHLHHAMHWFYNTIHCSRHNNLEHLLTMFLKIIHLTSDWRLASADKVAILTNDYSSPLPKHLLWSTHISARYVVFSYGQILVILVINTVYRVRYKYKYK